MAAKGVNAGVEEKGESTDVGTARHTQRDGRGTQGARAL